MEPINMFYRDSITNDKHSSLRVLRQKAFLPKLTFYKIFWTFFFGSFFGVVWETLYCLLTGGHWECRWGVIYGPFNPVYGFGAVALTLILKRISHYRDLWVFLICTVIGGAYEYLCSFVQEKLLGTISWNYDGMKFNFSGRTNLLYSFFWGLLGLLWLKEFYPRFSNFLDKISKRFSKPAKLITVMVFIFMLLNLLVSSVAVARQTQRRHGIEPKNILERFIDNHYPDEFLKKIYPNMILLK